jgi:hypothetical protein
MPLARYDKNATLRNASSEHHIEGAMSQVLYDEIPERLKRIQDAIDIANLMASEKGNSPELQLILTAARSELSKRRQELEIWRIQQ